MAFACLPRDKEWRGNVNEGRNELSERLIDGYNAFADSRIAARADRYRELPNAANHRRSW